MPIVIFSMSYNIVTLTGQGGAVGGGADVAWVKSQRIESVGGAIGGGEAIIGVKKTIEGIGGAVAGGNALMRYKSRWKGTGGAVGGGNASFHSGPINIVPAANAGSYPIVYLGFKTNGSGTIFYSIDGGPYTPLVGRPKITTSCVVSYYIVSTDGVQSPTKTVAYTIDPNLDYFDVIPTPDNFILADNPNLNVRYYGVSEGRTYPVQSIDYILDKNAHSVNIHPSALEAYKTPTFMVTLERTVEE